MAEESPGDRLLERYLQGELRVLNAQLPRRQKPLSTLLAEEHPHVVCQDGEAHLFKREELVRLAGLLEPEERGRLLLPLLIEVGQKEGEAALLCRGDVEEKVVARVLGMPVAGRPPAGGRQGRLILYRPQLAAVRRSLRTTTQYVFSVGAEEPPGTD